MRSLRWISLLIAALAVLLFAIDAQAAENACTIAGADAGSAGGSDAFSQALAKGPAYAALAALVGGLLVSLTPCVYPMIAVTVSVFGAREVKSRWQGTSPVATPTAEPNLSISAR